MYGGSNQKMPEIVFAALAEGQRRDVQRAQRVPRTASPPSSISTFHDLRVSIEEARSLFRIVKYWLWSIGTVSGYLFAFRRSAINYGPRSRISSMSILETEHLQFSRTASMLGNDWLLNGLALSWTPQIHDYLQFFRHRKWQKIPPENSLCPRPSARYADDPGKWRRSARKRDKMLEANTPDISGSRSHTQLLDDSCVFLRIYSETAGKRRHPRSESGNPPLRSFTTYSRRIVSAHIDPDVHEFVWSVTQHGDGSTSFGWQLHRQPSHWYTTCEGA